MWKLRLLFIILLLFGLSGVRLGYGRTYTSPKTYGASERIAILNGQPVVLFIYRPPACKNPDFLFVFAGYKRNASQYRDRASYAADRACLLVVAPQFDKTRFPNWRYQRGGVKHKGIIQPRKKWSGNLVKELVNWTRNKEGRPGARYILFGHSAGAQFLSRICAYSPPVDAFRIILANPSVYVLPTLKEKPPYGFSGVFSNRETKQFMQNYLSLPIVIYLGKKDRKFKNLVKTKAARRQGKNRYRRGLFVYELAKETALEKGWSFNWKLIEVPGVGHSSRRMLQAKEIFSALGVSPQY